MILRKHLALLWGLGCVEATPTPSMPTETTAQWDDAAAQELRAAMEASNQAWARGDIEAISATVAEDGFLPSYDLDMMGRPISFRSRAELLDFAKGMVAQLNQQSMTMEMQTKAIECRATAAFGVCTNEFDTIINAGGKTETWSFRGTGTGRKGPSGWQWTHWHASLAKLPDSPAAAGAPPPGMKYDLAALNSKDLKWETPTGAPPGVRVATVWGNPAEGAHAVFVEFPKKLRLPRHYHNANLWVTVLKGSMVVEHEGKANKLDTGGYMLEPGKTSHTMESPTGATVFQIADGPFDLVVVDEKGNPVPPTEKK